MHIRAVILVSQDARNWTILGHEPPIPLALLAGYAYVKPALVYQTEPGDAALLDVTPAHSADTSGAAMPATIA